MTVSKNEMERIADCDMCGIRPAIVCLLQSVEGRLFFYNTQEYVGHLCVTCIKRVYRNYTFNTFVLGWWSIYGFIRTPGVVFMNTIELVSCLTKLRRLSNIMRR